MKRLFDLVRDSNRSLLIWVPNYPLIECDGKKIHITHRLDLSDVRAFLINGHPLDGSAMDCSAEKAVEQIKLYHLKYELYLI